MYLLKKILSGLNAGQNYVAQWPTVIVDNYYLKMIDIQNFS